MVPRLFQSKRASIVFVSTALLIAAPAVHGDEASTFSIASPAFAAAGPIPAKYTCDGAGESPPLSWAGAPKGAASLALIVEDPDAPDPAAPKRIWVHWVLYDLPPDGSGLLQGVAPSALPPGTRAGRNDWQRTGYGGPCPPVGRHRYFFRLFALDIRLPDLDRPTRADLERAMQGHVLAKASLVGTYQRAR